MDLTLQARRDINLLPFGCLSTPVSVQSRLEKGLAGQVRTEQVVPVSTEYSVLLSATLRVTRWSNEDGLSGIWKWAETWPHQSVQGDLSFERELQGTGAGWGCPSSIPQKGHSGHSSCQCPPFQQKRH